MRQALLDTVTVEDLQAIVRQLLHKAKEGDVSAARLVLSYALGKPDRVVDPDALDCHEWHQFQQDRIDGDELAAVAGGMQAPLACALLRAALPEVQDKMAQDLSQTFRDSLTEPAPAAAGAAHPEPDEGEEQPADSKAPATPRTRPKPQRATGKPATGSAPRPLAGCDDSMFLAQEKASWIDFLKEVMDSNRPNPGAGPAAPGDP